MKLPAAPFRLTSVAFYVCSVIVLFSKKTSTLFVYCLHRKYKHEGNFKIIPISRWTCFFVEIWKTMNCTTDEYDVWYIHYIYQRMLRILLFVCALPFFLRVVEVSDLRSVKYLVVFEFSSLICQFNIFSNIWRPGYGIVKLNYSKV